MKTEINKMIEKYSTLVIKKGVNIQKGQILCINADIKTHDFVEILIEKAYQNGASRVVVNWKNELHSYYNYKYQATSELEKINLHQVKYYEELVNSNAAFISISSSDPDLNKDLDPKKIAVSINANNIAMANYSKKLMSDSNSWCVIGVPTENWAKKVFPNNPDGYFQLWKAILKTVRADQNDIIMAWDNHLSNLKKITSTLNDYKFQKIHLTNSKGTDLTIGLSELHLWVSGESQNLTSGQPFVANLPTEEVFTVPHKDQVDGIVYASRPLNYNGSLIENFWIEFKNGKAINWNAQSGNESLTKLITSDEGSSYLGEFALVNHLSPISQSKILFYNTLFDENASCHLALGKAYPTCLENGTKMNQAELIENGVNTSTVHTDFMFGTEDLKVTGYTFDQQKVIILENGEFSFIEL